MILQTLHFAIDQKSKVNIHRRYLVMSLAKFSLMANTPAMRCTNIIQLIQTAPAMSQNPSQSSSSQSPPLPSPFPQPDLPPNNLPPPNPPTQPFLPSIPPKTSNQTTTPYNPHLPVPRTQQTPLLRPNHAQRQTIPTDPIAWQRE